MEKEKMIYKNASYVIKINEALKEFNWEPVKYQFYWTKMNITYSFKWINFIVS